MLSVPCEISRRVLQRQSHGFFKENPKEYLEALLKQVLTCQKLEGISFA